MIVFASLLIWASASIAGASAPADKGCYTNLVLRLPSSASNEGWNDIGRGFLGMFAPAKLTDEHWEMIGKMKKSKDYAQVKDLALSMGGLIFLVVVSVLLLLCFCAAPISLCVFNGTCKKKCKPKSNAIVAYGGVGCASVAILTILLSAIFCFLSLSAIESGIGDVSTSITPLPGLVLGVATQFKKELTDCVKGSFVKDLSSTVDGFPKQISEKVAEIDQLKKVMGIDFEAKKTKIEEFRSRSVKLSAELEALKSDANVQQRLPDNVKRNVIGLIDATKTPLDTVAEQLKEDGALKTKLKNVDEMRKKGSKEEIEKTIAEKTKDTSDKIKKVTEDVNKQIEEKFKDINDVKSKIGNKTKPMTDTTDKLKSKLGYIKALNAILIPCWLALASAVWATCQATKFVQKKKAKPKERTCLLIPLAIGLGLAFLPIIATVAFMMGAGVSNVACGTIFKDESLGFLPRLMTTLEVESTIKLNGYELDIPSVIRECKSGKTLINAVNGSQMIAEDMVTKQFNVDAKKKELKDKVDGTSFGLPTESDWTEIKGQLDQISGNKKTADDNLETLASTMLPLPTPANPTKFIELVPALKPIHADMKKFVEDVDKFQGESNTELETAKELKDEILREKIMKMFEGDGTKLGMLQELHDAINTNYLSFRKALLETSTNCNFLFTLFADFGTIFCDQMLGGLNGAYAAIGLGVMSFFSATVGTVMIWHSLRAGKGQPKDDGKGGSGGDGSGDKKKKQKKGEKSGGAEGGEEETSPQQPPDMAGKVGEQATPIDPNQPPPQQQPGLVITVTSPSNPVQVVQAVPTDPAAPGDKTNPSLLPNDALPEAAPAPAAPDAGTPVSPIQMVPIEVNQEDNPKSQTGPQ